MEFTSKYWEKNVIPRRWTHTRIFSNDLQRWKYVQHFCCQRDLSLHSWNKMFRKITDHTLKNQSISHFPSKYFATSTRNFHYIFTYSRRLLITHLMLPRLVLFFVVVNNGARIMICETLDSLKCRWIDTNILLHALKINLNYIFSWLSLKPNFLLKKTFQQVTQIQSVNQPDNVR